MRNVQTLIAIASLLFSLFGPNASAQIHKAPKVEPLPRDLEIQLALSALPPHLRDNATVYVLNPAKGSEVARKGANGFHAFVTRTGDDTFRGTWPLKEYRDDILYPISFDEAGAKAQMRVFFDAAEMQAKGTPPGDVMHFAPNVSNKDVGGSTPGINPYPFVILHGPHGYTVQHFGQVETAAITEEYAEMLARLCKIRDLWCLPKVNERPS